MFKKLKLRFNKSVLKIKKASSPKIALISRKRSIYYKKFMAHAQKRPIATFLGLLLMLLGLILISNVINKPKADSTQTSLPVKEVKLYTIGESPKITVAAQVEKSGVIKIVSLGGGIVQSIGAQVGQEVWTGTNLVSLSSNYQGGNIFSVQRQLAQAQYNNVLSSFETSKELIDKQREIAEKSDKNSDELRAISNQSLDATRSIIDLNNSILSTLEAQQAAAEAINDQPAVLQAKSLRTQFMSGNLQLQAGLRASEYTGADDKIPAELANLSKDIALKQLDLQRKALSLNVEISRLSLTLAQVSEAIMFPVSPIHGVVERVFVREGQAVNPGTPLVQVSGDSNSLIAVALLSREMAEGVRRGQASVVHIGNVSFTLMPFYVSKEATDGQLYTAQFSIPSEYSSLVTDKSYITIDISVDFPSTGGSVPFVPIDAVFQTQDQAFLFVVKNGKAESRKVKLGKVIGGYVEVESGLSDTDQVILNRNVIQGDPVKSSK